MKKIMCFICLVSFSFLIIPSVFSQPANSSPTPSYYALYEKGDYEEAEALLRRSLSIYEKEKRPEQEAILSSMQNLAVAIWESGDLEKAEQLLSKVIEGFIRLEGIDSLNVASAYSAMGKLMSLKGEVREAEKYYKKALDIRQVKLGESDDLTLLVQSRLNELLTKKSPLINLEKENKSGWWYTH